MKIILSFAFSLLISFKLLASQTYCDFDKNKSIEKLRDPNNIVEINLRVNNYKKWTMNNLRILSDINENIRSEHKKRFKANLTVKYKFGICKYKVRIRQHGDWKDHIIYNDNQNFISQSLNVRINDGNILGITEFILFLPATRNEQNEIFTTHLLEELDFLAPRSYIFNLTVNDMKMNMIFQEKINKEFLENFNKKEGPILEGDEELIWTYGVGTNHRNFKKYELVSLSRLINTNWSSKSLSNFFVSAKATAKLQEVYLNYTKLKTSKNINLALDYKLLSNNNFDLYNKWLNFELLLISLNADHALRPHNRKFYWNIFKNGFEPIYYDGNSKIGNICKSDIINIKDLRVGDYDLHIYSNLINNIHFKNLEKKLNDLKNNNQFFSKLLEKSNFSKTEIQNNLDTITNNSKCIKKYFSKLIKNYKPLKHDLELLKNEYYKRLDLLNINYYSIEDKIIQKNKSNEKNMLYCNKNNICNLQNSNNFFELSNFLNQRMQINDKKIFYLDSHFNKKNLFLIEKKINGIDVTIKHTKDVSIIYNENKKEIIITQKSNTDRVIFLDGRLDNTNIIFKGISSEISINDNLINYKDIFTGCLTFQNITFNNVDISSFDGKCEDSVSFINTSGLINHININRSFSDALDFDFSNVEVKSINVENANNDCVDFSYGKYKINKMILNKCGDKGVSIGENSRFFNDEIIIKNSNIGIASKDSSLSYFNNIKIDKSKTCISAYNKKQEFDGGFVEIINLNCKNFEKNIYVDDLSHINVLNKI